MSLLRWTEEEGSKLYREEEWEMRRKALAVLVSLLVCTVVMIASTNPAMSQTKQPFKIGYVGGLTGPFAVYNVPALTGIKYAIEEINQAGGFQGRPVEIIVRDGKERPDVSLSEARSLVQKEGVTVLFAGTSSSMVLAVSAFAKEQKVLFMPAPTGAHVTGKEGHRYVFKPACNNSDMVGFAMGEYLAEKPWKKYYLIGSDYVFGHEALGYAWKRLTEKKPGVEKVGELWPKMTERDFTSYITAIMQANPEAVLGMMPGTAGIDFIKQAARLGFFKKIQFASTLLATADLVALGREAPEGIIGLNEFAFPYAGEKYPIAKKIQARYDRDHKDHDYTTMAVGYDTMLFLREAVRKAGSVDVEKIIDAMEGLTVETAVGPITCLKYSHQGAVPVFVGVTAFDPKYPFATLKDVKVYQGEKIMISEDEIRKMRGDK
jgi:branched-chain amino acid transport system substrate-binding protein